MTQLNVKDIIGTPNAMMQEHGFEVFNFVKPYLEKGEMVILSFEGMKSLVTSFVHASVGMIYQKFGENTSNLLSITEVSNPLWKKKINDSIAFGLDKAKREQQEKLLSEIVG